MSERPIQVGDLVQVIKAQPCCGSIGTVGQVFVVKNIRQPRGGGSSCSYCFAVSFKGLFAEGKQDGSLTHLSRLKRIPPLDELEGQKTEEKLKEPA